MVAGNRTRGRGRFARRMIALFLGTAVVPLLGVGALSFNQALQNARDQVFSDLARSAKLTALSVSDDLDLLARRLGEAARGVQAGDGSGPAAHDLGQMLEGAFLAVSLMSEAGQETPLLGMGGAPAGPLSPEIRANLADGLTPIVHGLKHGKEPSLWMLRAVDPADPSAGWLAARLNAGRLWTAHSMLPRSAGICVIEGAVPLGCATPGAVRQLAAQATRADVGQLRATGDGGPYFVSYWSLFMGARFGVRSWVFAAVEPEATALVHIRHLARVYGPAGLAIVLVATLILLVRLRTRVAPLMDLRDAADRIAAGDFSQRLEVTSDDEFEDLGRDFNRMAERLQRQFAGLSARAEIDRLILSSLDARQIVDTVLARVHELVPCDAVAMITLEGRSGDTARMALHVPGTEPPPPEELIRLSETETALLTAHPDGLVLHGDPPHTAYLESLRAHRARHFALFPIVHKEELAAVLVVGRREPSPTEAEDVQEMREFADRVAVALSNAAWEEKLYRQAHYDSLTGLPNRALMQDRLERALALADRNGTQVALMFVDLDRFKAVNDSLNHAAGDALLQEAARALLSCVREVDTVVRFGGDEFVVLLPDLPPGEAGADDAIDVVDRVLKRTRQAFDLDGYRINPTVSVGIALYPRDAADVDELLRNADTAMYHAKASGRDRYRFFAPELNSAALERLTLEQELREALESEQFRLHYQPQVEAATGRVIGAEALVRWEHPEKGLVSPGLFVPVAEETGLVVPMGTWVLRTAVAQARAWRDAGLPLRIAVNVAAAQLAQDDFPDTVHTALADFGLDPRHLELEVTESAIMTNTARVIDMLTELRSLGVRLSVDDFGTGYSSLSYLQRFPLNTLKVDQSFTRNMMDDPDSAAIAEAVVALGHSLNLSVIAEGVETEAQRDRLVELGCQELQGYLFSRPVPPEEFRALLEQGTLVPA